MRKIEQQMVAAIHEGRDWGSGNTAVVQSAVIGDIETEVYLYGTLIAKRHSIGFDTAVGQPFTPYNYASFPTATTRSRLRALGVDASIRNGVAYIGNDPA